MNLIEVNDMCDAIRKLRKDPIPFNPWEPNNNEINHAEGWNDAIYEILRLLSRLKED